MIKKYLEKYDAISFRADNMSENEALVLDEDNVPGKPPLNLIQKSLQINKIMALAPEIGLFTTDTGVRNGYGAYYTVMGNKTFGFMGGGITEYYKGAIYPYKDGYTVYIYLLYEEGGEASFNIIKKLANGLLGVKDQRLFYLAQIRDEFLSKVPEAKIVKEYPRKLSKIKTKSFAGGLGRKIETNEEEKNNEIKTKKPNKENQPVEAVNKTKSKF